MLKYLVMDLGETIIHHEKMNFEDGLIYLYNHYLLHNRPLKELLDVGQDILNNVFKKRDNDDFELSFYQYLNHLNATFGFKDDYDFQILEEEFVDHITNISLMPHVIDLLEYAKKENIKIIIFSNSCFNKKTLLHQLKKLHIDSFFYEVFSSADYLLRKPNQLFFSTVEAYLKRIDDVSSDNVWYIGNDYHYDIEGCKNSLMRPIWYSDQQGDVLTFSDYLELLELIKEMNK